MSGCEYALSLRDVQKHYPGFILGPLTIDVEKGSVVGLVGRNGAGKTTLMKLIFGAIHADAGEVELFGHGLGGLGKAEAAASRQRTAFVSDLMAYPPNMKATELERLYALFYPGFSSETYRGLCDRMGLEGGKKTVKELSRGMGMKLQLACALASGADLLVMDEPTAGLDPIVRDEVLDIIRSWMEDGERSAMISSHITSDLERLADRVVLIDEGRPVLEATADELAAKGIARLRSSELDEVLASGLIAPDTARVMARELSFELLVDDRAAFEKAFPAFVCDKAGIDEILLLMVKGELR